MKKILICAALLFAAFLNSCSPMPKSEVKSKTWYDYFDTVITLYGNDTDEEFGRISYEIEKILSECHDAFDVYGDGDVAKINENAGKAAVRVSERTLDVLEFSLEMYEVTDEEINVAFGAVLGIWHDYRERALLGDVAVPTQEELEAVAKHTDVNAVVIDRENGTVYLTDPEASLDLGAVAKGYTADLCRERLVELGKRNYAVSLGGNVAVCGAKNTSEGWRIGIEDPNGGESVEVIELFGNAVSTSGSYQRYYEADGVRYHHIIDVDTLFPENEFLSVTVVTKSAAMADALSTALFNMTETEGKKLAESMENVFVLWIGKDGKITKTDVFPE